MEAFRDNIPRLVALGLLVVLSGLISSSETALFALTRQQLARFRQSRRRTAQLVIRLREDSDSLLATVLLANITVNILLYSMLAVTVNRLAGASPLWTMIFGLVGFLIVLFGAEIIPKLVAFAVSDRLAPLVAFPLRFLQTATWPIHRIMGALLVEPLTRIFGGSEHPMPPVSADELQQLVNISQDEGHIDERENALLHRVMDLADRRVKELMVPRVDVVAFNLADSTTEFASLVRSSRLLRIPAYENDIDHVKGIILVREFLLNRDRPLRDLVRPVHFIPEQARVEALLAHFRSSGSKLALVVDEYGGIAGVVALEDVVEAIVGELHAPDEPEIMPTLQRIDDTTYVVDPTLDVDDFCEAFRLPLEESRFNTVGGLIAAELDRVPKQGDRVSIGTATLAVVAMKAHRILQVRLTLTDPVEESPDLRRLLDAAPHRNVEPGTASGSDTP